MPENAVVLDERDLARTYNGSLCGPVDGRPRLPGGDEIRERTPGEGLECDLLCTRDSPRSRSGVARGLKPDPANAIDARELGWLDATSLDPEFVALNTLVANVFSGGPIDTERFQPMFSLNHRQHRSHVIDALEATGLEYEYYNEDTDDRATEVRPTIHGTVLGRTLAVLGAPIGPKADLDDLTLPWYLDDAPYETREMFALAYLANRAVHHREKDTLTVREVRSKAYRDELAAFLEDVAKEPVTSGEQSITVSADAARSLGVKPRYEGERVASRE